MDALLRLEPDGAGTEVREDVEPDEERYGIDRRQTQEAMENGACALLRGESGGGEGSRGG